MCVGNASSMAALLFAAGDTRCILPHGQVMIHDPLVQQVSGSTMKIKDCADSLLRIRTEMAHILSKRTGRTVEEILEKTEQETTFRGHHPGAGRQPHSPAALPEHPVGPGNYHVHP